MQTLSRYSACATEYLYWLMFNFLMSLVPVALTWAIDYDHTRIADFSDAVFLGIVSFAVTLLLSGYYARVVGDGHLTKRFSTALAFLVTLLLSCLFLYYYKSTSTLQCGSNFLPQCTGNLTLSCDKQTLLQCKGDNHSLDNAAILQFLVLHKFYVVCIIVVATLILSSILNWPAISGAAAKATLKHIKNVGDNGIKTYNDLNREL